MINNSEEMRREIIRVISRRCVFIIDYISKLLIISEIFTNDDTDMNSY